MKPIMDATCRSLRFALSVAALAMLAACGSLTDAIGVRDPFAMNRPFEGTNRNWEALTSIIGEETIFVAPIAGLDDSHAADLAERIAEALQQRDVLASSRSAPEGSLVLAGQYQASVIRFSLTAPDGTMRGTFDAAAPATPEAFDGIALSAIADATALRLADDLGKAPTAGTAETQAPAINTPRVRIGAITAEPDGAAALLARAAATGLARRGVVIADEGAPYDYELSAAVTLSGDASDRRLVTINWTLADSAGTPLGDVTQANEMPIRDINGPWNETAALAGDAAADGIAALLAELTRRR